MELAIFVLALLAFDVTALLWGADSRDGLNSPEWLRKQLSSRFF